MAQNKQENLVWMDLEMTGLDPEKDRIIEMATIVTNNQLDILEEGPVLVVTQPVELLQGMDKWNTNQHTKSGLVQRVLESQMGEAQAEQQTLQFIKQYVGKNESPLCGNSVCQDRRFLYRYMPELAAYLHYRNLDISTLKELARRWKPPIYKGFKKDPKHRALDDIRDSIEELRYYRSHFIIG